MRIGAVTAAVAVTLSACASQHAQNTQPSRTAASPPTHQATAATSTAPTVADTVSVPGEPDDWSLYGGTFYNGCPQKLASPEQSKPQIFDTGTGKLVRQAAPPTDTGGTVDGVACALTGTPDSLKLVYIVATSKAAQGLQPKSQRTSAFVFDIGATTPTATADITAEIADSAAIDSIAGTGTGLVVNANNHTIVLSNRDLSVLWTDPEVADCITSDALVFTRANPREFEISDGMEVRSATGETIFNDSLVGYGCNGVLYDGPDHLIRFDRFDSNARRFIDTSFFDVNKRSYIQTDDVMHRLTDGSMTISNGRILVVEPSIGMRVWNIQTGQVEYSKPAEQYSALDVDKLFYFDNRLYVVNYGDAPSRFSVYTLPDEKQIAAAWTHRPIAKLNGWTLVLVNSANSDGDGCRSETWSTNCTLKAVKDQNGGYPGPWT
jgi:hypothetical protein